MTTDVTEVPDPTYASSFVLPAKLDEWVAAIVDHYANVGVPLPDRRYWTISGAAADCEQMVLAVQQMFLGTAAEPTELTTCNGPRGVTFTLQVLRCVPTVDRRGQAPAAENIEAASVDPVIDMEIFLDLAAIFDEFHAGIMVTIDPIPAQGGYHGVMGTYTVNL